MAKAASGPHHRHDDDAFDIVALRLFLDGFTFFLLLDASLNVKWLVALDFSQRESNSHGKFILWRLLIGDFLNKSIVLIWLTIDLSGVVQGSNVGQFFANFLVFLLAVVLEVR